MKKTTLLAAALFGFAYVAGAQAATLTYQCDFSDNMFFYRDIISFTETDTAQYQGKIGTSVNELSDACSGENLSVTPIAGQENALRISGTVKCVDDSSFLANLVFDQSKLTLSGTWKGDIPCQVKE